MHFNVIQEAFIYMLKIIKIKTPIEKASNHETVLRKCLANLWLRLLACKRRQLYWIHCAARHYHF